MITELTLGRLLDSARQRAWSVALKLEMMREIGSDSDQYTRRINAIHRRLRVPLDYPRRGLPLHQEASELVAVPCGHHGKIRLMTSATQSQWLSMRGAATADGVTLLVRWGFRGVDDQARLIREQLASGGESIERLLTWIAAPGYSEHHTGRALDFECIPAHSPFEDTSAFHWLKENAWKFNFGMSYPVDNPYGITFEPWHWFCQGKEGQAPDAMKI